ncbi:hypothetical protein NPIL_530201 [Nephila pilipes]|uniref:Uncharacterized protein n=1 Tax=Nephila pilipes TaxID=299642 RepID=A0A8X6MQZ2_NEPPI|nr:hypothetical protein NPIL_530201 [Nephila pilipes]
MKREKKERLSLLTTARTTRKKKSRKNGKEDRDNVLEREREFGGCGEGQVIVVNLPSVSDLICARRRPDVGRVVLRDIRGYFCARVICQPLARRGWADRAVKPLLL